MTSATTNRGAHPIRSTEHESPDRRQHLETWGRSSPPTTLYTSSVRRSCCDDDRASAVLSVDVRRRIDALGVDVADDQFSQIADGVRVRQRARRAAAGPRGANAQWSRGRTSRPATRWTAERVAAAIRAWVHETGEAPQATAWVGSRPQQSAAAAKWQRERPRWPSADTVRSLCGSWQQALEQAGCPIARQPPDLAYAERIEAARRMSAAGHTPAVIATQLGVSADTVRRYLRAGSCRRCGAPVTASQSGYCAGCIFQATHVRLYPREEISRRLIEWQRQTGAPPRVSDWTLPTSGPPNRYEREYPYWPPASSAASAFGSWRAMLREHGLPAHTREPWTRQDILDALIDGATRLGQTPSIALARADEHLPSVATVAKVFGSWNDALAAAGLEALRIAPRQWTNAQILAALRDYARDHGRAPTGAELITNGGPAPNTVASHFGTWNAALDAAGVGRPQRPLRWTEDAVIAALQAFAAEHGRRPQARDFSTAIDRSRWPNPGTVAQCFGSWNTALRAAAL